MRLLSPGVIVLGVLLLAGCGAQSGHTMMTYDSFAKEPPGMNTVQESAVYALYPSNSLNPIVTKELKTGDQYGFVKNDKGKVVAAVVTNNQRQEIALTEVLAPSYYWKRQK